MSLLRDVKYPNNLVWTPTNPIFRADAVKQVRATLARAHAFSSTDERAVTILVFNEFMRIIETMALALRVLLGFVGTLTLAIGGVGLANIMLVSVTQRTREIGVLKSLGATRRAILFQFLVEALAIVTLGGILGVLVGYVATVTLGALPLLGPMFKDQERPRRHPPRNLPIRRADFDADAAGCRIDRRPAARRESLARSSLDPIEALWRVSLKSWASRSYRGRPCEPALQWRIVRVAPWGLLHGGLNPAPLCQNQK